jgi:hypothetical protein
MRIKNNEKMNIDDGLRARKRPTSSSSSSTSTSQVRYGSALYYKREGLRSTDSAPDESERLGTPTHTYTAIH